MWGVKQKPQRGPIRARVYMVQPGIRLRWGLDKLGRSLSPSPLLGARDKARGQLAGSQALGQAKGWIKRRVGARERLRWQGSPRVVPLLTRSPVTERIRIILEPCSPCRNKYSLTQLELHRRERDILGIALPRTRRGCNSG